MSFCEAYKVHRASQRVFGEFTVLTLFTLLAKQRHRTRREPE